MALSLSLSHGAHGGKHKIFRIQTPFCFTKFLEPKILGLYSAFEQTVKFLWVNGLRTQIQFQKQPDDSESTVLFLHPPNLRCCWATCG